MVEEAVKKERVVFPPVKGFIIALPIMYMDQTTGYIVIAGLLLGALVFSRARFTASWSALLKALTYLMTFEGAVLGAATYWVGPAAPAAGVALLMFNPLTMLLWGWAKVPRESAGVGLDRLAGFAGLALAIIPLATAGAAKCLTDIDVQYSVVRSVPFDQAAHLPALSVAPAAPSASQAGIDCERDAPLDPAFFPPSPRTAAGAKVPTVDVPVTELFAIRSFVVSGRSQACADELATAGSVSLHEPFPSRALYVTALMRVGGPNSTAVCSATWSEKRRYIDVFNDAVREIASLGELRPEGRQVRHLHIHSNGKMSRCS